MAATRKPADVYRECFHDAAPAEAAEAQLASPTGNRTAHVPLTIDPASVEELPPPQQCCCCDPVFVRSLLVVAIVVFTLTTKGKKCLRPFAGTCSALFVSFAEALPNDRL